MTPFYVDFDDTLIVRGKVNTDLVRILFASIRIEMDAFSSHYSLRGADLDAALRQVIG